jgi:hypothetical protein
LKENLELLNVPAVLYRADDAFQSVERLKSIKDAVFIFLHDKEQFTLSVLGRKMLVPNSFLTQNYGKQSVSA